MEPFQPQNVTFDPRSHLPISPLLRPLLLSSLVRWLSAALQSEVAAERIMLRMPGCTVRAYTKPIQQFSRQWYTQFNVIVAGLDNVEARRWLNETVVDLAKFDSQGDLLMQTMIPLIDGGTEGSVRRCLRGSCHAASVSFVSLRFFAGQEYCWLVLLYPSAE